MRYQPSSLGSFWVSADGYELQMKGNSQNSRSYANFEAVAAFALLARALVSTLALGLALWPISAEPTTKINQNKAEPMQRRQRRLRQRCSRHTPRQAGPRPEEHTKMLPLLLSLLLPSLLLLLLPLYSIQIQTASALASIFALSGSAALRCSAVLRSLWLVGLWTGAAQSVRCRQLTCTVCGAEVRIS